MRRGASGRRSQGFPGEALCVEGGGGGGGHRLGHRLHDGNRCCDVRELKAEGEQVPGGPLSTGDSAESVRMCLP